MPTGLLVSLHSECGDDFQKWEAALLDLFNRPVVQDAIFIASPRLHQALDVYHKHAPEKSRRKVLFSLYKYLIRMSTRATPFGLFSVTATGLLAAFTDLSGRPKGQIIKSVSLQPDVLSSIADQLKTKDLFGKQIRYSTNTSLYRAPDGYRYVERLPGTTATTDNLVEIEHFPELEVLINAARIPVTKIELMSILCEKVSKETSTELIDSAIDNQLLVSELSANVTGPDFQSRLCEHLDQLGSAPGDTQMLLGLLKSLSGQSSAASLKRIAQKFSGILPRLSDTPLFRAQLTETASKISLGKNELKTLVTEFAVIRGLLRRNQQPRALDLLKAKFRTRYGDRKVPICELMDDLPGIEYAGIQMRDAHACSLLEKVEFTSSLASSPVRISAASRIKKQLLETALSGRLREIEIDESDLTELSQELSTVNGVYWLGEMLASSQGRLNRGQFKFYLKAVAGQSGLELMARFAHSDESLASHLLAATSEIVKRDSDVIHAEIVHLAGDKAAGILTRPHLWPYEIPYLAKSTLDKKWQIPIDDILVSLSEQGSFILTSKSLSKRIIPHNTTAHNYFRGLPLYQLLSDLANQDSELLAWDWEYLEDFSFLPRISYRHLILSPACWNLSGKTRQSVLDASGSQKTWTALREQLQIPRYFQICRGDNVLLIDGENRFSTELFISQLQKKERLQIQEYLHDPEHGIVKDAAGSYAHELVVAFKPAPFSPQPAWPRQLPGRKAETRIFQPGSEWLYVKVFLDIRLQDQLLTSIIGPVCLQLTLEGQITKWYFVRYLDPSAHLRIRFQLTNKENWHLVFSRLQSTLQSGPVNVAVKKIQTDTYHRELERYHSLSFDQAESIFHQDSMACVKIVSLLQEDQDDQRRWMAGLLGVDVLLGDFGLDIYQKGQLAKNAFESFAREFGQDQTLTRQLNQRYRQFRPQIQQALVGQAQLPVILGSYLTERSAAIRMFAAAGITAPEISSYVHMFVNRVLQTNHRKQEMIILYFLSKYYHSAAKLCTN